MLRMRAPIMVPRHLANEKAAMQETNTTLAKWLRFTLWLVLATSAEGIMPAWGQSAVNTPWQVDLPNMGKSVTLRAMSGSRELEIIRALGKAFGHPDQVDVGKDDKALLTRFCDSDVPFDMLVTSTITPLSHEKWALASRFPSDQAQPLKIVIGQARVLLVVDSLSQIDAIELSQVRELLRSTAKGKSWQQIIGKGPDGVMKCFGPATNAPGTAIIRKTCMQYWTQLNDHAKQLHIDTIRGDLQSCDDVRAVLKGVRSVGTVALGVVEYPVVSDVAWNGVKPLSVKNNAEMIIPRLEPVIQSEYPLAETIVLYVHPKAITRSEEFVRFCLSKEGAAVCEKYGFVTPWHEKQEVIRKRLAEMKSGKGVPLPTVGLEGLRELLATLGVDYVRGKAVIQMAYAPTDSDVSAMGLFLAGAGGPSGKEFLLLEDRPGERALATHGQKWNELNPAEQMLAGRAVAVIVNPSNKLEALTLEQVTSIFSGEVDNWKMLAAGDGKINRLGLRGSDPAAKVFYKEAAPAGKLGGVTVKMNTAEAVSAVSMDANAIAFVDLTAIPEGQTVKVLPITVNGKPVRPTADSIQNAMYPLSQRLFLYVHPKASDTAKDFVKFITSGACDETFKKNGLIPFSAATPQGSNTPATVR